MDPIESVQVGHDSTFLLMLECRRRDHEVWVFEQKDLSVRGRRVVACARKVEIQKVVGDHFHVLDQATIPVGDLDAVFMRKDPPVDVDFLHATLFADLVRAESSTVFVNSPAGLRDANEKLYALRFPDLLPKTIVSANRDDLVSFLDEVGGEMIVKPIDGFGGKGIFHVHRTDRNARSILETVTDHGREAVVAQEYLPASREGDKRIIVLDGEPIGAMLRVPSSDDHRGNLAVGGKGEKTEITERDREICSRLAPDLRSRGLVFVGLDVIGGWLTEVNVTSPTGLEEIDALAGLTLERDIVDYVEGAVASGRDS